MGLLETGNLSFIRNEAGYVFLRQEKENPPPTIHTKQLFNQEANSLGWFLFTCWLEIPFFFFSIKRNMWGSPGISHLNHIIKAAYKHMHTHEKKPRQVKTITINSVSFSFHSSVSAAGLYSIRVFQACSQPHQSVCVLPYDSIGATSRSNFRQIVRELK